MKFERPSDSQTANPATGSSARKFWVTALLCVGALLTGTLAQAQLRVDISGTGAQQYPVAIADFSGEPAGKQIAEVIRADLTRSGQFKLINATGAALTVDTPIAYDEWRSRGADFIAYGTVVHGADGRYDVRYRLGDTIKKGQLDGVAFSGTDKELRRVTRSPLIDTEPAFSADGKSLYFTSDRSGSPQIYQVGLDGGEPKRITFNGGYNISPRVSPDGKTLLTVTRRDGTYRIASLNLATGSETLLTEGRDDQSPSFAPNGMQVLYAATQSGRSVLAGVSSDGRVRQTLSVLNGEIREPTWGPFTQ